MRSKLKLSVLAAVTCLGLLAAPGGQAQPYRHGPVIVAPPPGLSIILNDRDFDDRWHHSDVHQRGDFCRAVRRDCEYDGRRSRACDLKWRYCTPQGHDYGYYYNH